MSGEVESGGRSSSSSNNNSSSSLWASGSGFEHPLSWTLVIDVLLLSPALSSICSNWSLIRLGKLATACSCCKNTLVDVTTLSGITGGGWDDVVAVVTGVVRIETVFCLLVFFCSSEVWSANAMSSLGFESLLTASKKLPAGWHLMELSWWCRWWWWWWWWWWCLWRRRKHREGHTQRKIRTRQHKSPLPIRVGPMRRSSSVLKPFSPVPTKEMTRPMATVPNPTYSKAFAAALWWPYSPPGISSSSELLPPYDESWI